MKFRACIGFVVAAALVVPAAEAQQAVAPASGQKTLAATMNVYVFPKTGQTSEQQSTDEAACYGWAVQNTGTDPFQLQKQAQVQQGQAEQAAAAAGAAGTGAGARGAVRGAAAGALIGEIANDDAGQGAAYGAAAGLLVGHRRKRIARHEAQAQVQATSVQAQQATATELENFKKAFSVCLEAKDYLAKY
jgi:hypothetical protein